MEKRAGGSSSTTSRHQAVIIGAGPSGIGAARTLFQAGIDAVILEGRDRIGGRMWETSLTANLDTRKGECGSSVTIQLGANWIHGLCSDFNPMFERAQQLQLSLHQTSSDDEPGHDVMLFDSGSYCIPPNPIEAFDCTSDNPVVVNLPQSFAPVAGTEYQLVLQRYYWIRERFDQFCSSNAGILSLSQSFEQAISCSENELGICSPLHRRCLNWIFDRILIDWAEDSLENLEAMVYASTGSDGAFGEALVAGGYFKVLEDLALEFPLTVLLNHVVESVIVMDSSECVEIHCSNGSIFVADHCIVTLPVGVLKSMDVTFVPKIPPAIESVLSQVSVGLMNLVWILFPAFFWPDNVNFFGVARDSASTSNFTTFLAPPMSDSKGCRQPVLMCQVTGQLAKEIEILSDESIAVKVMKVLRNMFGESIPNPIGIRHSNWSTDRFSRGSWCHLKSVHKTNGTPSTPDDDTTCASLASSAGVSDDSAGTHANNLSLFCPQSSRSTSLSVSAMSSPPSECLTFVCESNDEYTPLPSCKEQYAQRVFYAGEACHEVYRGTVHGAFLSGIREAGKVIALAKSCE